MQFGFAAHDFTICFTSDYLHTIQKPPDIVVWMCFSVARIGDVPTSTTSPNLSFQAARAKSGPLSMLISAHVASRLHPETTIPGSSK